MTFKTYPEGSIDHFNELYKENGVTIVGNWQNADNPKETYFITSYRDQQHYEEFTQKMKENTKYIEASKQLDDVRESIEVVNLKEAM